MAQRDALRTDPVTSRLAALLGTTTARAGLLSGLAFAGVPEGVACVLWAVALRSLPLPRSSNRRDPASRNGSRAGNASQTVSCTAVSGSDETPDDPVSPVPVTDGPDVEVAQLARDVSAGRVRATVADIRRHLGCSQSRAIAPRRKLARLYQPGKPGLAPKLFFDTLHPP